MSTTMPLKINAKIYIKITQEICHEKSPTKSINFFVLLAPTYNSNKYTLQNSSKKSAVCTIIYFYTIYKINYFLSNHFCP